MQDTVPWAGSDALAKVRVSPSGSAASLAATLIAVATFMTTEAVSSVATGAWLATTVMVTVTDLTCPGRPSVTV